MSPALTPALAALPLTDCGAAGVCNECVKRVCEANVSQRVCAAGVCSGCVQRVAPNPCHVAHTPQAPMTTRHAALGHAVLAPPCCSCTVLHALPLTRAGQLPHPWPCLTLITSPPPLALDCSMRMPSGLSTSTWGAGVEGGTVWESGMLWVAAIWCGDGRVVWVGVVWCGYGRMGERWGGTWPTTLKGGVGGALHWVRSCGVSWCDMPRVGG